MQVDEDVDGNCLPGHPPLLTPFENLLRNTPPLSSGPAASGAAQFNVKAKTLYPSGTRVTLKGLWTEALNRQSGT
eukprot:6810187-Karenia_brevis.AAC.1